MLKHTSRTTYIMHSIRRCFLRAATHQSTTVREALLQIAETNSDNELLDQALQYSQRVFKGTLPSDSLNFCDSFDFDKLYDVRSTPPFVALSLYLLQTPKHLSYILESIVDSTTACHAQWLLDNVIDFIWLDPIQYFDQAVQILKNPWVKWHFDTVCTITPDCWLTYYEQRDQTDRMYAKILTLCSLTRHLTPDDYQRIRKQTQLREVYPKFKRFSRLLDTLNQA
jgi:hypothetical protein